MAGTLESGHARSAPGGSRLGLPLRHPAALTATWFGVGLLRPAPGSWASLSALPLAWAIDLLSGAAGLAIAAAAVLALGCWAAGELARASRVKDPGFIVIDEVAAQWLALVAAPRSLPFYALAFLLFRLFDIVKPWPAGWIDRRVEGGFGIMLDDVAAAGYAVLVLLAVRALVHV